MREDMRKNTAAADPHQAAYNYQNFSLRTYPMVEFSGPRVGDLAPDFTATRLDGTQVALSELRGAPVVLETGSVSCPMYVSRIEPMNALAFRFPRVAFLVLYVREAHPGHRIGPHRSPGDKASAAQLAVDEEREGRTVVLDDLNGSAHQLYGQMPNTVYVIDEAGRVAFRAEWNDPAAVDAALRHLEAGGDAAAVKSRFRPAGAGTWRRVLWRAGWRSVWDFVIALVPLALAHLRRRG